MPSETAFEKIDSRNEVSFEENLEIIKRSSGAKDNYDYTSKNIRKLITKLVGSKKKEYQFMIQLWEQRVYYWV
ncbi:hypothetical protein V8V50_11545 [Ligilactobacillus salivarius]